MLESRRAGAVGPAGGTTSAALIRLALALWITYAPWLAAGLVLDAAPLWLTPLAVYGAATLWLAARLWLSLRTYRCTECGLTWRGGKAVS